MKLILNIHETSDKDMEYDMTIASGKPSPRDIRLIDLFNLAICAQLQQIKAGMREFDGLPPIQTPLPPIVTAKYLLQEAIKLQHEIEKLRATATIFNEPYQSESSKAAGLPQNNTVLAPLTLANWSLQNAQCALELKLATEKTVPDRSEQWLKA